MDNKSLSEKVVKNTFFSIMATFWMLAINFLLTPYIIYKIGLEKFGIWAISASIVGFLGLFNLGTSSTYTKYIAEYRATGDLTSVDQTINTGLVINILLGLCMSLVLFFIIPIIKFFKFNPGYFGEVYFVVFISIVIFVVVFISEVFNSIIDGVQRIDVTNKINIFMAVFNAIGTIIFLQCGWGLRGLVINSGIIVIIAIMVRIISSFYLLPSLKLSPQFINWQVFRKMIGYGAKIQVSRIANFVNGQIDKILLGHFINVLAVGYYDVGARLVRSCCQILLAMNPAVMPAASELHSINEREKICALYMRASKYLSMVTIPILFFVLTTASVIVTLWVGQGYGLSILTLRFLMIGFMLNMLTAVGTSMVRGIGKPQLEMRYELGVIIANFILSWILIIKIGFIGTLIGTAVSLVVFSLYFMLIFHKQVLADSYSKFAKKIYFIPFVLSLSLSLLIYLVNLWINNNFIIQGRMAYFFILSADTLIFWGLYIAFIFKLHFLETKEVKTLIKYALA
jgi:O-antigen/teichoic acid export membrane protein